MHNLKVTLFKYKPVIYEVVETLIYCVLLFVAIAIAAGVFTLQGSMPAVPA